MNLLLTKQKQLEKIAKEIENCKVCQQDKSGKPVPGEGNPNAKIMFVGEAPGKEESLTGRPFVGRSGRFLTSLLNSIGIRREDIYITSPVKHFPGYRVPTNAEIAHGREHLQQQISIINPKLIVLLGNVAARAVLKRSFMVNKMHGELLRANGRNHFFTFHPSAALRFPKIRKLIGKDFKKLSRLV